MIRALSPARRAAVPAIAAALATGVGAASLGDTNVVRFAAFAYIAVAGAALAIPRAITAQLVAGQLLAALALATGTGLLALTPVIAGIILTTELLGIVARLDAPLGGHASSELRRTAFAMLAGTVVFVSVAYLGDLAGPSGFLAIVLASAACFGLGYLLVRSHAGRDDAHS